MWLFSATQTQRTQSSMGRLRVAPMQGLVPQIGMDEALTVTGSTQESQDSDMVAGAD